MNRIRRFLQDNAVLLAVIVLAVWLVVVWVWFRASEEFAAYATFGTALASGVAQHWPSVRTGEPLRNRS